MASMLRAIVLLLALSLNVPLGAQAHMEMRWPYSFRSKFNPANTDPDYDNTFPLKADGSDYPCKGYQDLPMSQDPIVTYTPGQSYNLTLAGTATHGGGSCQISLSYDDGKTFRVIKSMIGGCPLKLNWDFTIPTDAPPSNGVILAWTWFNLIGNREMYMQCARVAVAGQAVQRYRRTSSKRQMSIGELPEVFTCNIGNGCQTLEMHEVVCPNPGQVIENGADAIGPSPGPGYLLNGAAPSTTPAVGPTATAPITTSVTLSTSVSLPTITTPPFPMPNATTPGAFFPGTGTGVRGTGYYNVTRTVTLTEFVNATSTSLISNSSVPATTTRSAGDVFKTITYDYTDCASHATWRTTHWQYKHFDGDLLTHDIRDDITDASRQVSMFSLVSNVAHISVVRIPYPLRQSSQRHPPHPLWHQSLPRQSLRPGTPALSHAHLKPFSAPQRPRSHSA